MRNAFNDPEVLRKPPELWPKTPPGKMHCARAEFLKLASRWDKLGACMIIPAEEKCMNEAVGLFCVAKDSEFDRLILNPGTLNSRMFGISRSTKELAPGCLLGLLHLQQDEMYRFNADDFNDFYCSFLVSPQRAKRNAFKFVIDGHQLSHLSCYSPSFANNQQGPRLFQNPCDGQ